MEKSFNFSEFLIKMLVWVSAATSAKSSSPTKNHWKRLALCNSLWNVANQGINLDPPSSKIGAGKVFSPLAAVGRDSVEKQLSRKELVVRSSTKHCSLKMLHVFVGAVVFLKKNEQQQQKIFLKCNIFPSCAFPFSKHELFCLCHLFRSLGSAEKTG